MDLDYLHDVGGWFNDSMDWEGPTGVWGMELDPFDAHPDWENSLSYFDV